MSRLGATGWLAASGGLLGVALLVLCGLATGRGEPRSLNVYCAVSLRPAVEAALARYEANEGIRTALQLGPSGGLETQIRLTGRGDLYVPAAVMPFLDRMRDDGLVDQVLPVDEMRLVLAAGPAANVTIASIDQLLASGEPFGLCNVQAAAGERARSALQITGHWDQVATASSASLPTVTELAEAVRAGGRLRYGLVWNVTAEQFNLHVIEVPELAEATAQVGVGVLSGSQQPEAARRLARYLTAINL